MWKRSRLTIERLESRCLLAGDCSAFESNGDLIIECDGADNDIVAEEVLLEAAPDQTPIIVNVMNFAKAPAGEPVLITMSDARTLFHEFGHFFAAHHHQPFGREPFDVTLFAFRAIAGCYLSIVFWYRGYGPAAGCHAAYNVALAIVGATG